MKFAAVLLLALAGAAAATTPKPEATPVATSQSSAESSSAAHSRSAAVSGAKSVATGGMSSATSGDSAASSSNEGNSLTVTDTQVRQTPGMGQGSFAIQGCAVAGNAGGSGPGATGFLGFGFTPEQCYDFMLAQAYAAAGAYKASCEVLNASKAGQRAKKRGVTLPTCVPPAPPVQPAPPVDPAACVPRDEQRAREKKIIETCTRK